MALFSASSFSEEIPKENAKDKAVDWKKEFKALSDEDRKLHLDSLEKGRALFAQKRIKKALDELFIAAAIYPDSPEVENMIGACFIKQRNFDKAMEHFERALALTSDGNVIRFNIAEIYFVTKKWKKALEAFEEVHERPIKMVDQLISFSLVGSKS